MLIKISDTLILDRDELLSIEKSIRNSIIVYFKNRKEPCSYIFSSYEERKSAFEKILKEIGDK